MFNNIADVKDIVTRTVEVVGTAIILGGAGIASARFLLQWHAHGVEPAYREYRRNLGRAILLGLEFLVAGDIINTVAVNPTFRSIGMLAGIVLIRTFLSFSLEVEIDGCWPWQRGRSRETPSETPTA